jgi:hypothetical protein
VLRFDVDDVDAYIAERYGRGKARSSALTPAAGESTDPLLPFESDSSQSLRRGTVKHKESPDGT